MKSHTELSKTPLPIPTVACKLHYWTSNEHQCQIPDDNISARSYHEKAPKKQEGGQKGQNIRHGQYYSVKQNFVTSSGGSWILPNKRPDHLRDSLKEMEETLKSQSVLHVRWIKRNRMQIILHTGLLINILLSDTYDIQKIVFDKSLIGKISQDGGAISSAFLSRQFCLLSFTDKNKLGFASFTQRPGTPDHKQVSNKISSMDMKISFHDIPGTPNRKSEKKFCVNKLEDKAVCWCPSYKGPNSWTPTSTDKERANMILLGCSFGRLEVLNYVQTECDPLSVDFSNLNPYQIHTLEKSVNVRKESFLHYTVYECLQNKIQRLNVSTLPLKSGLLSSARNKTEDKVVIGCTDGTLIVYNIITKAIVQVRESLVPSVVSWHPNGGIVMVASGSAELRCYDTSLSPLTTVLIGDLFSGMPGSSLKLSQFLTAGNGLVSLSWLDPSKDESSDNHGVVQQTKLNPAHDVALVLFDGGPLAILKLNLGVINKGLLRPLDIIKEYLSHRNVTPAIQVLNNINWNTDGHQAFHGLISIINHLLKLPLNHERENQLEGTLATFYAPSSPLSESVVVQYRHAISRYARKFFFHLLRFGRYEKSFLLAQDIQAQDLFVDLHFAAKEVGENRIARAAKERAYDLQSSGSSEGEDEDSYSDDDDHINMQARILQESRQDGGVRQSRKGARSQGDRSKDRRDKDKLKRTVPPSYPPPKMNNFMTALMNEARAVVQENSGAQEDEDQDDAAGKSSSSLKNTLRSSYILSEIGVFLRCMLNEIISSEQNRSENMGDNWSEDANGTKDVMSPKRMWSPPKNQSSRMDEFRQKVNATQGLNLENYHQLYRWSVENYDKFWELFWKDADVLHSVNYDKVVDRKLKIMDIPKWFAGSKLNYAENILRFDDDRIAIFETGEHREINSITHRQLKNLVSVYAKALRNIGVTTGDRVVGYLPNCSQAIIAMLAAASIGAIWSSTSPDFGVSGVLDRFKQIEPSVIFSVDAVWYNGKIHDHLKKLEKVAAGLHTLKHVIVIPFVHKESELNISDIPKSSTLGEFLSGCEGSELKFEQLPFNHPLFIMYSSGTTGPPKCMVHSAGGTLLQHMKEHLLHGNMKKTDILLFYTTTGWMMWNWLVGALSTGGAIVLYDGSPFQPHTNVLWDLVDKLKISILGTSAKCLSIMQEKGLTPSKSHKLDSLHTILSTGSPLAPYQYDYVYEGIKSDVVLGSITGGTDIISCFMGQNFAVPVYRGEIQACNLGMAMSCYDEEGKPVLDDRGELVCSVPFPCMPTHFWNDKDGTLYKKAYFSKYPGVWAHGDYCVFSSATGGIVMLGRSDATLNPNGVRFGSSELYRIIEGFFSREVEDSLAVAQRNSESERVILFLKLTEGTNFTDSLVKTIKSQIRDRLSPRHVPALILETKDIPYTISGKKVEIAVANLIAGKKITHDAALKNPESLRYFENIPELKGF